MSRYQYYEDLKSDARAVRATHGLDSPRVMRSDMRRIYDYYGIKIDLWPHKLKNLRGAFFNDRIGPSVMLDKSLPDDPMIFTMGHELKHFLKDRNLPLSYCHDANINQPIEIGAEVFAAELIFPEQDFIDCMNEMGIGDSHCTPEMLVQLKHDTKTTLSYQGLAKRAERLRFAEAGSLRGIKWKKLEEKMYGVPFYKRKPSEH